MKTKIAMLSLGLAMTTWVPGAAAPIGFDVADKRLAEIAYYGGDFMKEREILVKKCSAMHLGALCPICLIHG